MNPVLLTFIIIISIAVFLFLISLLFIEILYHKLFYKRGDGHPSIRYYLFNEFPNLVREPISFFSQKNILHGYIYSDKKIKKNKGLILMVHGIGFGHSYLYPLINYFCQNGYLVLAYDQSASGISEGKRIKGLTRAIIDLEFALEFVKNSQKLQGYPLYLFGHSWGGYAVLNALNFSNYNIEKVISVSGFNSEIDFVLSFAKKLKILKPILMLDYLLHYGKYAKFTALEGLEKTNSKVLFLQGEDDATVSLAISGALFKNVNNRNVRVELLANKGHTPFVDNYSQNMQNTVMAQYGFLGGVDIALDMAVDFRKISIPDEKIFKLMLDFYND